MVDDDVADRDVVRSRGGKSRGNTQFVEYITMAIYRNRFVEKDDFSC